MAEEAGEAEAIAQMRKTLASFGGVVVALALKDIATTVIFTPTDSCHDAPVSPESAAIP